MIERYSSSFLLAAAITFGLMFLMQSLIATGRNAIVEDAPDLVIDFAPHIPDETIQTKKPALPEPPVIKDPPAPVPRDPAPTKDGITGGPGPIIDIPSEDPVIDWLPPDGDVLPLVRVPADYPRAALARGIEGHVIMQFDVSPEGTVKNIQIVEAVPEGVFERSAMKALSHFKYRPKVVNGQAVERHGIQFQMTYKLNN